MQTRYRGGVGLIVMLVCAVVAFVFFFRVAYLGDPSPSRHRPSAPRPAADPEVEQWVQKALAEGTIHSVDIEASQVRLSADLWLGLTLEQKQQSVLVWSRYFQSHGGSGRVKILNNQDDTCLATYSS